MFGFGKKNNHEQGKEDGTQNQSTDAEKKQTEKEAEEKIVYFFLIGTAIFGAVLLYLGISKEFT
jgi:Ca2+/Na+ antiporter